MDPAGVPYGVPRLDKATLGLRPAQLVILAGRPGMVKTCVALHVALAAARNAGAVGFFSLEMDGDELAERVLALLAYPRKQRIAMACELAAATALDTAGGITMPAEGAPPRAPEPLA